MSSCKGNVFIYILIAVVLMAALTYTLSKNQDSNPGTEITDTQIKSIATSILSYTAAAQNAVNNMSTGGTEISSMQLLRPDQANFNTAPNTDKLFHPDGGGLQYKSLPPNSTSSTLSTPVNGYYIGTVQVEWTPTTTKDLVLFAYGISKDVCTELNRKITGSTTIPSLTMAADGWMNTIATTWTNSTALDKTACLACDEKPALCVKDTGTIYTFYNVLVAK